MDNTNQIFAALAPTSGILMYAEKNKDLTTSIADYANDTGCSTRVAAAGVIWYRLPADTEIDDWCGDMSEDGWRRWEAANPTKIPEYYVEEAVKVLENDRLATNTETHIYYDDATSRYFITTSESWGEMESEKYESYSLWCSTGSVDLGASDGYEDEEDAIAAAAEIENDKLATFEGTPRAPGFKIPEPPADL
jgi:hypothetical protein